MKFGNRGGTLELTVTERGRGETRFRATYRDQEFSGAVEASDHVVGSPLRFFEELAENWRGFAGEKSWADLEGSLSLTATADNTGHVYFDVQLRRFEPNGRLDAVVVVESGQWPSIIAELRDLFGAA